MDDRALENAGMRASWTEGRLTMSWLVLVAVIRVLGLVDHHTQRRVQHFRGKVIRQLHMTYW